MNATMVSKWIYPALVGAFIFACGCTAPNAGDTAQLPEAGKPWALSLAANTTVAMAWIPPGTFTMGSPRDEAGRKADEGPATQVTLTQGFWLGRTMVTIGQWKAVTGRGVREQLLLNINDDTVYDFGDNNQKLLRNYMNWSKDADPASYLGNEDDNLPVYFVSWNQAMEFCHQLTTRERAAGRLPPGYEYTLPTEAQWEYACRAGTTEPTYAGPNTDAVVDSIAWYSANAAQGYAGRAVRNGAGPRDVAQKLPNAWGLDDMLGDIWQWCHDWYGPYPGGSVTDPQGPVSGMGRVNRGGSFGNRATDARAARRATNPPPEASAYRGFRLALAPIP